MKDCNLGIRLGIFSLTVIVLLNAIESFNGDRFVTAQEAPTIELFPEASEDNELYRKCQSSTVRIIKADSAGTGAIVAREGNYYSVLTSWHVVSSNNSTILTADDREHQLINAPEQLGDADLAVLKFYSETEYPTAAIQPEMPQVGDTVYAAGFPLAIDGKQNERDLGNEAFLFTKGIVSIIPDKSLPQGYRLGYTNDTAMGMSGSPIFNTDGLLVGIHGRGKYRDPGFGVYIFEDGSEPSPTQLEEMISSSWGIPIGIYSDFSAKEF